MRKLRTSLIFLPFFLAVSNCRPVQAQACATAPVQTASGPALACASSGAACSPAINGGGAGKCTPSSVKMGSSALKCVCAAKGKGTKADPPAAIKELLAGLSSAKRGDVFTFQFDREDLTEQQNYIFFPNLFDARPRMLSTKMVVEVIGRGKHGKDDDDWKDFGQSWIDLDRQDHGHGRPADTSSPSLTEDTLELSLTGNQVFDSFDVAGAGPTGVNTETFVAGTLLFNLKKLVFEGLITAKLTNDIWTKNNPIVLAEGWSGSLDPKTNSVTFETGAPDDSFIVPETSLIRMSATPKYRLPLPATGLVKVAKTGEAPDPKPGSSLQMR
jgi:hypothetical protein